MSDVSWVNPPDTLRQAQREEAWFLLLDPQVRPRVRLKRQDGGFLFFFYFHVFTVSYFSARSRSCAEADSCCSEEKPQGAFLQESCAPSSWSTEPLQTLLLFGFNTNLCSVSFIYIYIYKYTLRTHWYPPFFLLRRCEHMTRGVTRRPTRWGR